jgi:pimeloyl-ACP methyl ester carboxylesterase
MIRTAPTVALGLLLIAAAGGSPAAQSSTRIAPSRDGTRIAYDVAGSGPVVMLLHGGGQTRRSWHDAGYVERLAKDFTVVTIDARGHGESDKPTTPAAYEIDRLIEDVLAVADAVRADRFSLWGFSYGANIGRYVALRSKRVRSMVYIGIPFGPAAPGKFREMILALRTKWTPIIEAHRAGKLDEASLTEADRKMWQRGRIPVDLAWLTAMLDYPPVEPIEMSCPTLWLVGTANAEAFSSVTTYKERLAGTLVSLVLLEGLTHPQELERVDQTLPPALEFTRTYR